MYPVEYEVHVWNSCKGEHGEEEVVRGVVFANSFTVAMKYLEKYYGDDLISIKVYMLGETSVPLYEFGADSNSDFHGMFKFGSIETYDGY